MTDLRIKQSTRALLDASFAVLMVNPHASLSEIASQAGVGRATLYRHYPTREHLISAIAVESLQMIQQAMAPIIEASLKGIKAVDELVTRLLPLADRFHFMQMVWTLIEMDQQVWRLYSAQIATIKGWITQGQADGEINPKLSVVWVVSVIDSMMYSASWLIANGEMTTEQGQDQFSKLLVHGIAADNN